MLNARKSLLKKVYDFFVFTLLIFGIYSVLTLFIKYAGINSTSGYFKLIQVIKGAVLLLWILGISYNVIWTKNVLKNHPAYFAITVLLMFGASTLLVFLMHDINEIYPYVKTDQRRGFKGHIHQKDSLLGYKPISNSEGLITFQYKDHIPIKYDENGFRIPHQSPFKTEFKRPLILFLGCSVTWGNACYAEETFPFKVGDSLDFSYINAGVCGYGLSQMYILAHRLIPKYNPDYVVVQYSDWLAQRTARGFAPSYVLKVPNPYFSLQDSSININYPRYLTDMYVISDWAYNEKRSSLSNYLDFTFNTGVPSLLKNYAYANLTKIDHHGKILNDIDKVEQFVYGKIAALVRDNNSRMILLKFGHYNSKLKPNEELEKLGVPVADAYSLLKRHANNDEEIFSKMFHHWVWNGQDSIMIDIHPNPRAHTIIAESIITEILLYEDKLALHATD